MIFFLAELPNSIVRPKQIFEIEELKTMLNFFLLPVLVGLLIYLIYYFYKAQKKIDKSLKISQIIDVYSLAKKLKKIKFDSSINYQFREAVHILSFEMRYYLSEKTGESFLELTTKEINKKLANKEIENFFIKLTELQFRKSDPLKFEFEEIFDIGIKILEIKKIKFSKNELIQEKENV